MRENISNDITSWLISLPIVDSTNNYAMQLIQDGLAYHGLVVSAAEQTKGKGQRGKVWLSEPGENVVMSIVIDPQSYMDIYWLSFLIPLAVCKALQEVVPECQIKIKWPNDIYVGKQKLAGILIENVFRGSTIKHTVIGVGINANQVNFEPMERMPISLKQILGQDVDIPKVIALVRKSILAYTVTKDFQLLVHAYNDLLCFKQETILIQHQDHAAMSMKVLGVNDQFQLEASDISSGIVHRFDFGSIHMMF